jgi:hypothetical protein
MIGTTHSFTVEMNRVILPKCTLASYNICILLLSVTFHLNLHVLELWTESLYLSYQAGTYTMNVLKSICDHSVRSAE